MTRPYARYADIYDRTGQDRFGAAMAKLTVTYLKDRGVTISSAIDLACGTGSAAIALARHEINVTGIDLEPAMLGKARANAAAEGCDVDFRLGDMRRFGSHTQVDLVVCFFDSLNYLSEAEDVAACFKSVSGCLKHAGWFVFDVNTINRLATDWNDSTFVAYDEDDLLCLVRSTYDAANYRSPLYLTTFHRESDNEQRWTRWDEEHIAYAYSLTRIEALLKASRFQVIERYAVDDASMTIIGPGNEESGRVLYFAQLMRGDEETPQ
jgi:SAM-dependent methyltransferase